MNTSKLFKKFRLIYYQSMLIELMPIKVCLGLSHKLNKNKNYGGTSLKIKSSQITHHNKLTTIFTNNNIKN